MMVTGLQSFFARKKREECRNAAAVTTEIEGKPECWGKGMCTVKGRCHYRHGWHQSGGGPTRYCCWVVW